MINRINKIDGKMQKHEIFLKNYLNMFFSSWDRAFDKSYVIYFKLNNGICIEQKIFIRNNNYICYTNLAITFDIKNVEEMKELFRVINKINTNIEYGNFEFFNGELRFKTFYSPREVIDMELLDELIGYPHYIINQYGNEFKAIIN